jgi:hypothetical protein
MELVAGEKPVAWEGVGVRVPCGWDFMKHQGFFDKGMFVVGGLAGERVDVSWWQAGKSQELEKLAERTCPDGLPWTVRVDGFEEVVGVKNRDQFALFVRGINRAGAVVVMGCDEHVARDVAGSLVLGGAQDGRAFAVFECSVTGPAGYALKESELQAGMCQWQWSKGRRLVNFKRFSAANVTLGLGMARDPGADPLNRLAKWASLNYAKEMGIDRQTITAREDDQGRLVVDLAAKKRWFAGLAVTTLIPAHIKHPVWARVIWDVSVNKLVCVDTTQAGEAGLAVLDGVIQSVAFWPCGAACDPGPMWTRAPGIAVEEMADGNVAVIRKVPRPAGLKWMRAMTGGGVEKGEIQQKSALDGVGSWLWRKLEKGKSQGELVRELQEILVLSQREAELSVGKYLSVLQGRGLVQRSAVEQE